ncbi:MAG: barstar family protein [Bdellovibrionaceae bacterium]|nr:barstar family protein [Pseudobdellovibrionaceae bacterium]
MKRISIDCSKISSLNDFHRVFSEVSEVPDYYGKNLDALWDVLTVDTPCARFRIRAAPRHKIIPSSLWLDFNWQDRLHHFSKIPRPKAILQNEFPYHVSARCINKEWFHIPMENVWDIFCRQLTYISWVYDAKVHAFVLKNNHFHLLVSTPRSNLKDL